MRKLWLIAFAGLLPVQLSAQPVTNPSPVGVAGAYNAVAPTCTTGNFCWLQLDVNGKLLTSSTSTPSGTQDINIKQVQGAVPSLTNPLWIVPATGASFAVTGTFFQATQPVSIAAAPLAAIGITPTDRTITSATGSSQTVMASNAARHSLIIQNTGNANCGINPTGGTAVIGGAGTLTLVPQGSYQPMIPTLAAVTAICTAAQPLYAEEN